MPKRIVKMSSGIDQVVMDAYFKAVPAPVSNWKTYFPTVQTLNDTWKTLGNQSYGVNVAADPVALGSSAPIKSRTGMQTVSGGFGVFKVGRLKDESEIEEFNALQNMAAQFTNPAQYQQILTFLGDDVKYVRNAALSQANYLNWALLSSACNLAFIAANSPQLSSLNNITYPVATWQKNNVATSWSNPAALIIADVKSAIDTARTNGRILTKMKINDTWFNYVRANTQVQNYCATYIQNALNLKGLPTLESVNSMLQTYFNNPLLGFEIINELVSREAVNGTITTANPFADGVVVFTSETRVGSFQYKMLSSRPDVVSVSEDFYIVERLYKSDPDTEKTIVKFKGMSVIDSYADNFYLRVNATPWE
jgi:hypothetical protein